MQNIQKNISILISDSALDLKTIRDWVASEEYGGVVIFEGSVRNRTKGKEVIRLEFEAYVPMAEKEMQKIAEQALHQFEIGKISIQHRIGILLPGELPVIIGVSAAHRDAAFKACQFAIDELKQRVPIWKKEVFGDGEMWVAAHP